MRTIFLSLFVAATFIQSLSAQPLAGTQPLDAQGDLAARMVEGIDKYLMRETTASVEKRKQHWKPDFSSPEAYTKSVQPNRERLKKILGVVDQRVPVDVQLASPLFPSAWVRVAETDNYKVFAIRWSVLEGVEGDGLMLLPKAKSVAHVVVIPDADQTPEMIAGLAPGVPKEEQFARRLVENGCVVIVPTLIDRKNDYSGNPKLGRMTNQPHREFIYRMAYQMGRHIIGYEVQKVLAAVDYFSRQASHSPIGVLGYGEGGHIALVAGALDERIKVTTVSGYFGPREGLWQEPIFRNVWGYLHEFGDAEMASLFVRRDLILEAWAYAEWNLPTPQNRPPGAAPGKLRKPALLSALGEAKRIAPLAEAIPERLEPKTRVKFLGGALLTGDLATKTGEQSLPLFLEYLQGKAEGTIKLASAELASDLRESRDSAPRQHRQFDQLVNFTQKLMRDSEANRAASFWAKLDTSSLEKYQASTEPFRKQLWEEIIGKLPAPTESMNPRSRLLYDEPTFKAYEVTLDLYPDVYAYGILCVPKGLKSGEKRAVVVCQHGLEGRPTDVVNPKETTKYYNSFGSELAKRGYVVFAPQNPYIGHDKFRVLQRKANPLGLSLFSFIIRQHERILDWLATQPFVDAERMGFYGLSYGGKTAMRVPAVLPRYCLSICSGDFNEWTWKNVSYDFRGSYMFSPEYEMPEFNLGQTIVYAEMAALIAPRPFMVERGHDDGVGIDEWVAYEYAKVRRLYSRLKIPERTEIEWFAGGHECHNTGTFAFLDRHLKKNW